MVSFHCIYNIPNSYELLPQHRWYPCTVLIVVFYCTDSIPSHENLASSTDSTDGVLALYSWYPPPTVLNRRSSGGIELSPGKQLGSLHKMLLQRVTNYSLQHKSSLLSFPRPKIGKKSSFLITPVYIKPPWRSEIRQTPPGA